ncbi:MAG: ketoacyl-ACP synthase III [bacterium]|nr:ketoacyl-ACP synthase III [bacterium]
MIYGVKIAGIGRALPGTDVAGRVVTNEMLSRELLDLREELVTKGQLSSPDQWAGLPEEEQRVQAARWQQFETGDEWIVEHTGIRERREAAPKIATSDLAIAAGKKALEHAGWDPSDVGIVLVATVSPDHLYTSPTAALVHHGLGIPMSDDQGLLGTDGMDISCACSSFGKAFKVAYALIVCGMVERVLITAADVMSRTYNRYSRALRPILGDAGAAVALERVDAGEDDFFGPASFFGGLDGSRADLIVTPVGGTREPLDDPEVVSDPFNQGHRMVMQGPQVKRGAVRLLVPRNVEDRSSWPFTVISQALDRAGVGLPSVEMMFLHQANMRIIDPLTVQLEDMGFKGVVFNNIERVGNTTSASIPLLWCDALEEGSLRPGMTIHNCVFGGGLSWEAFTLRWSLSK